MLDIRTRGMGAHFRRIFVLVIALALMVTYVLPVQSVFASSEPAIETEIETEPKELIDDELTEDPEDPEPQEEPENAFTDESGDGQTVMTFGFMLGAETTAKVHTVTFYSDGVLYDKQSVEDGDLASKPSPDPVSIIESSGYAGYVFKGWYNGEISNFDFDTPVTGDVVLHALFEKVYGVGCTYFDGGKYGGSVQSFDCTVPGCNAKNVGPQYGKGVEGILGFYFDGDKLIVISVKCPECGVVSYLAPTSNKALPDTNKSNGWNNIVLTGAKFLGTDEFKVIYAPGTQGDWNAADQTYKAIYNTPTPAFTGDTSAPKNPGYKFAGWDKPIAAKVSGDVTYTALWEKDLTQTRDVTYTVMYTLDGVEVEGDTYTVTKTVWIGDPADVTVEVDTIDAENDRYDGYELKDDPFAAPATAKNGDVIVVPYISITDPGDDPIEDPGDDPGDDPVENVPSITVTITTPMTTLTTPDTTVVPAAATPAITTAPGEALTTIKEAPAPLAALAPTVIPAERVPLANVASWALLNLMLTIVTGLIMAALFVTYFFRKKDENEDDPDTDQKVRKHLFVRLITIATTAVAIILFILTQDMSLPMIFIDQYTIWHIVIAAATVLLAGVSRKSYEDEELEEERA